MPTERSTITAQQSVHIHLLILYSHVDACIIHHIGRRLLGEVYSTHFLSENDILPQPTLCTITCRIGIWVLAFGFGLSMHPHTYLLVLYDTAGLFFIPT